MGNYAQGLTITNGEKDKTFKEGSVFQLRLTNKDIPQDGKIIDWTEAVGVISQMSRDSFTMILKSYENNYTVDYVNVTDVITSRMSNNYGVFSKNDLFSLRKYKSYKSKKRRDNLIGIGGIFMFTGMITSMNAFLVPEGSNRNKILISGCIQVGLGIGSLILYRPREYNFNCGNDFWEIKH
jgi:hypothetical protein